MSTPSLAALYPAHLDTLQARTAEALRRGGFEHLVIPSGTLHYQAFDDRDYPYAVNPQFKAWLPLTQAPGSWLVITPGKRPALIFLQPHDYWHAVPAMPREYWVEQFDIQVIRTPEEAVRLLPPVFRCAILGEAQSALGSYVPNNPEPVLQYLEYHRAFKTPYEIEMMRQASRIGVRAHRAAERAFRAGASEFGIHLAYCQAAGQDANDLPYGNIVALNEHAAVLHYTQRERLPPKPVRSFLIDAGASVGGYASDITRTYSAQDDDFAALIRAVDTVQLQLCDQVRAGTDYRRIHLDAHLRLAGVLREFGVLRIAPEDAVARGVSSAFFPHGIGHGIGLQVHDVAGFAASDAGGTLAKPDGHPYLRLTRTLAPGMVVTIEPGIYFIDMLLDALKARGQGDAVDWERVAAFKPYGGIRIEDDVACTDQAPLNLTREAFAAG
ncbi:Xaa-Pro dipeptidase [Thermomonas sp. S9]|jgi:Xaa-Pro dipeptidase|uniref:Xaa-Pro dipeptidase n=1 Tax=Thermomonas sp. S9 TaxID=2885203 RepID=UPI001AD19A9F|nr:Xaa-Pro dipeptidase [Thermomonas sp. S9]MBN8717519.1 Xaa-Pro dipeptidase [Xanthomonadales bacterium]MBN8768580.1 Xaa-Pro dipeptidase [Stenotrophomonas sp.]MCR6495393.1 Xaa-Pro dipeptidase [Thermomonas sp. S9]